MSRAHSIIEKIVINHSDLEDVNPGDYVDLEIDTRIARDFGGANVVKNIIDNNLEIENTDKTFFTFDCNPGGSDQKYAANQQKCRLFAREKGIKIYDINTGIGTHLAIDNGLIQPGGTFISTDSHANIIGAIGAFGQGMGDVDIAAAWSKGKIWFKVPQTMKVILTGKPGIHATAKDIVLKLLQYFGANGMLGYAVEYYGEYVENLTLEDRITISSMATEMGAIITFFTPSDDIISYIKTYSDKKFKKVEADDEYEYDRVEEVDISDLVPMISKPGHPEDVVKVDSLDKVKIDSAFIGSCTNGRYDDMKRAAEILKGNKVAPGVVLKIVPATDEVWKKCLETGLLKIFKNSGALVGNAGCAGCAAGQIGQNGPGEITISSGNRNYAGKQGKGYVYLASPSTIAASAIAGIITTENDIPENPVLFEKTKSIPSTEHVKISTQLDTPLKRSGRVWIIPIDNIDTDMIFHNRYLTITDLSLMGQYAFDNLKGWEDFAKNAQEGDFILTGKNFGAGSSRQQAVDCFKSLKISGIIAESYGAIYERNAINAGFPILKLKNSLKGLHLQEKEIIEVNYEDGIITRENGEEIEIEPFNNIQINVYLKGGLLA